MMLARNNGQKIHVRSGHLQILSEAKKGFAIVRIY